MIDNDEALSLPRVQVFELLESFREKFRSEEKEEFLWDFACDIGSVRMLQWGRENDIPPKNAWALFAVKYGHLPALQWLHENGCPLEEQAFRYARAGGNWDCLQYLVDNKCPGWEEYADHYAEFLR